MTTMHIRQCPRCELRFTSSSELQDHLTNDHRPRRDPGAVVVAPAPQSLPPGQTADAAPVVGPAPAPRSRPLGWVLALSGVVLIALVAWQAPTSTALITSAWIVLLVPRPVDVRW